VVLGDEVTIGHLAMLHGCTVEERALVGIGAVVLDGAVIGRESVVGAKALVTSGMIVPPRSLVLGVPAKVVRELRPDEIERLALAAQHYVENARRYREALEGELPR
jgi:carbonic anhydrase/acetyltransferase-like protein (isoleucine patch superfamily)